MSPEFKDKVGADTSVQWPAGIGAKGNEGVANMVKQTQGAIGYVEYAYVKQNKMQYAKLMNKDGKVVDRRQQRLPGRGRQRRLGEARPASTRILANEPGDKSWPITGASFILMPKQPKDAAAAQEALKFFAWAYKDGGKMAEQLDYVPMPDNVVKLVEDMWKKEHQGRLRPAGLDRRPEPSDPRSTGGPARMRGGRRPLMESDGDSDLRPTEGEHRASRAASRRGRPGGSGPRTASSPRDPPLRAPGPPASSAASSSR